MTETTKIPYVSPEYLSCADTAKLVRKALKGAFPGVKFSVRSSTYSGGASIRVGWTDGPTSAAVDKVVRPFSGADFDGMVDLKTYNNHWLMPDGSVAIAHAGGQGSTRPEVIGDPPSPNARLVSFGADFIFSERKISDEWKAEIVATFEEKIGRSLGDHTAYSFWNQSVPLWVDRDGKLYRMVDTDTYYLTEVFHRYTGSRERGQA